MPNFNSENFEERLQSLQQLPRLGPDRDLLPGIKDRLQEASVHKLPARQWASLVAAAVLLLLLNYQALETYSSQEPDTEETFSLVSDYTLYE